MMNSVKLTSNKNLYNFCSPYIIAELGSNHNGDMNLARNLIISAKKAGADCVKFQSWTKDTIFAKEKYQDNCFLGDDYRQRDDYTLESIVEEYSISESQLLEMKTFCDEVGIECTSTPFSRQEVDFLVNKLHTPFIKIASMDLNNTPFLRYIASQNLPVILSTGLSSLAEIDTAIKTIEQSGNSQIVILHCVSLYPPEDTQVNLNNIDTLQAIYDYPVGFSDHTLGTCIPLAAVAKGACLIEKHFTLDRNLPGWDHKVSATVEELACITEGSKRIADALGSKSIKVPEDDVRKHEFRRSIVVTKNISAGAKISESDIDFKRPGNGISPDEIKYVIGRTLAVNKSEDEVLKFDDLV